MVLKWVCVMCIYIIYYEVSACLVYVRFSPHFPFDQKLIVTYKETIGYYHTKKQQAIYQTPLPSRRDAPTSSTSTVDVDPFFIIYIYNI
jgi:hypothetical protein